MSESKHTLDQMTVGGRYKNVLLDKNGDEIGATHRQKMATMQANAAHIVKCVNAYPVMLEALKSVVNSDWSMYEEWLKAKETAKAAIKAAEKDAK